MNYKTIAQKIVTDIWESKLKPNDKLMSENQFMIKYQVSRMMVTKAFEMLKRIGAIYSKPKQGYYISEFFTNLAKPLTFLVDAERWEDQMISKFKVPLFFKKNTQILSITNLKCFQRKFYKKDKLVAIATSYYDADRVKFNKNESIIAALVKGNNLISSVSHYSFEKIVAFGNQLNLVSYQINYASDATSHMAKIIFNPLHFKLVKQETSF